MKVPFPFCSLSCDEYEHQRHTERLPCGEKIYLPASLRKKIILFDNFQSRPEYFQESLCCGKDRRQQSSLHMCNTLMSLSIYNDLYIWMADIVINRIMITYCTVVLVYFKEQKILNLHKREQLHQACKFIKNCMLHVTFINFHFTLPSCGSSGFSE